MLFFVCTDILHAASPTIDVRCISDSGTMYPWNVHTDGCDPYALMKNANKVEQMK